MANPELPSTLLHFIEHSVPTYQAAEVILFLASNPDGAFTPEELVDAMRPSVITVPAAKEYTALIAANGVASETDGRFRYAPAGEMKARVGELVHAYNEKPVTLIRAIMAGRRY